MFFADCILAGNDLCLILAQVASECAEESQRFSPRSEDADTEEADIPIDMCMFAPDQKPRWFSDVP